MKYVFLLLFFFSQLAFAKIEIGKPAPNFKLPANDGKTYELSAQKGKWVVLEWFNNDCPYVDKHYNVKFKNMQNLQLKSMLEAKAKTKEKELVWLTIVSSAPGKQGHLNAAQATQIKNERGAHMSAILLDPSGSVGNQYEAKTTPHMFIINPKGILEYDGAIDNQPSAQISTLEKSKNYVTAALSSLFVNKAVAETKTKPYGCSVKY